MLCRLLEQGHVAFVETVPFRVIAAFTVLQFVGLAVVYVVSSWTGVSKQLNCFCLVCALHADCKQSWGTNTDCCCRCNFLLD